MVFELKDISFPLLVLSLVIAYQITIYFIYQYYKVKDEKVELNMILLAYGLLYGFGVTGIFIRYIYYIVIDDISLGFLFINLSHTFIVIAFVSFQIIISKKCFNEILNTNISKSLTILTLIISLLLYFITDIFLSGIIIIIAFLIGYIYMVVFHIKLIHLSTGEIKRRIYFLFFGECILMGGIAMFSRENQMFYPLQIQHIMQLFFSIFIFAGLIIIFLGVFRIPIFLEFHWKENLISFFIIDAENLNSIYSYNFIDIEHNMNEPSKAEIDQDKFNFLFPRGILGIERITSLVSDKNFTNKINKIEKGNFTVLLRYGGNDLSFIVYCLVIDKEMTSINYFFKILQNQFENIYKYILRDLHKLDIEEKKKFFLNFDENIKDILK